MRICVFGAGAVGGHIAVRLKRAGHDVSVMARGANLAAMRANGITLRAGEEMLHADVNASDLSADLGPQDVVISTLKANALSGLATTVAPLLGPETAVVFAQNGIPWWYDIGLSASRPRPPDLSRLDEGCALREAIEPARIIGAVISSSNEIVAPGVIVNASPKRNMLHIGESDDADSPRIVNLRTLLTDAGIASPTVTDIRQAIWRKLVINMTCSILCLLTGHKATVVRDDPRLGDWFIRLAREAVMIANAHDVDLSDFNAVDFRAAPPDHLPSIRQDFDRQKSLELESMLVTPVSFGKAAGLETPGLDGLVALAVRMGMDRGLYQP